MATQPRKGFKRVEPPRPARGYDRPLPSPQPEPRPEPDRELIEVDGLPTLEQCENVALALGFPILPEEMRPPYYLDSMRNLHSLVVRTLNGDEQAERSLATLKAAFGRPDSV